MFRNPCQSGAFDPIHARVADDVCFTWVKEVEAPSRTFELEKLARWAFTNGYRPGPRAVAVSVTRQAAVSCSARSAISNLSYRANFPNQKPRTTVRAALNGSATV
jgi:hypothetical protein